MPRKALACAIIEEAYFRSIALECARVCGGGNNLVRRQASGPGNRALGGKLARCCVGFSCRCWSSRSNTQEGSQTTPRRPVNGSRVRRSMARPREFDEVTVLEAAMNCFWAQGFESTSVRDLAEQMGITGASLYNAFGDKRSLYRQVLAHYLETSVRDRVSRLEQLPPFPAIRAFFDEIIQRSVTDEQRRGCCS